MNFAQLNSAVRTNIIDLPTAVTNTVPVLVNQAIRDLCDQRNFAVMRAVAEFNTTVATRALGTMPTTFKEFITTERPYFREQAGSVVFLEVFPSEDEAYRVYTYDDADDKGAPAALSWTWSSTTDDAPDLKVWPLPDGLSDWTSAPAGEYRIRVPYFRYPADLVNDGDSNWFTINGAPYIEHYATGLAFMRDWDEQRGQTWFTLAQGFRSNLIKRDARMAVSNVRTLIPRSDVNAPISFVRF